MKAIDGLEELKMVSDTLIVLDNNKLLEYYPELPIHAVFSVMDQLIADTIKSFIELMKQPAMVNLDPEDVKAVFGYGGTSVMLVGEANIETNAVVTDCLRHPLLDVDYRKTHCAVILISGGYNLSLLHAERIVRDIVSKISPHASVIWGARIDNPSVDFVRVVAIMTNVTIEMDFLEKSLTNRTLKIQKTDS